MGITIKQIGKLAGVHESTVSRALRNSHLVDSETRDKILEISRKYNYRPNRLASGLALQKTSLIGVIIPDLMTSFYPEVMHGIEDYCSQNAYHILFAKSDFKWEAEKSCVDMFIERQVDGVIWCSANRRNIHLVFALRDENIPCVLVDTPIDNPIECDCITVDNVLGGYLATQHLIQLGHRAIVFMSDDVTTPDRYRGYQKALNEAGIPVDAELRVNTKLRHEVAGYQGVKQLLEKKKLFTAIFAVNDSMAIGAMRALEDLGIRVPNDVAIVGFDDILVASYLDITLTTIRQPKYELGEKAAEILMYRIQKSTPDHFQRIILKPTLIPRKSTVIQI